MSTLPFKPVSGIAPPPGLASAPTPVLNSYIDLRSTETLHLPIGNKENGVTGCIIELYNYAGAECAVLDSLPIISSGWDVKAIIMGKDLYDANLTTGEYQMVITLKPDLQRLTKTLRFRVD